MLAVIGKLDAIETHTPQPNTGTPLRAVIGIAKITVTERDASVAPCVVSWEEDYTGPGVLRYWI